MENKVQERLSALATSRFRAKFHLSAADQATVKQKGLPTIRQHAAELLGKRLFPANPPNDGKQTPMRGYPVFVAQHATATCCRSCLWKWHKIPKGQELSPAEQEYVLDVIEAWIVREMAGN
jgi:exodeoxyribonuclease V alpha subunit